MNEMCSINSYIENCQLSISGGVDKKHYCVENAEYLETWFNVMLIMNLLNKKKMFIFKLS